MSGGFSHPDAIKRVAHAMGKGSMAVKQGHAFLRGGWCRVKVRPAVSSARTSVRRRNRNGKDRDRL